MFTGLIETVGTVSELKRQGGGGVLVVASTMASQELELGESIAVNGACLTVTAWTSSTFSVDISPESFERSTLGKLRRGQSVNLERALRLSDRLGGHLVSGHIDGTAVMKKRYQDENAVRLHFEAAPEVMRYVVEKGSIAIDGISLTVNSADKNSFSVAIIPHSLGRTTLKDAKPGSVVNIETDLIGRYIERFVLFGREEQKPGSVNIDLLAKNGFL